MRGKRNLDTTVLLSTCLDASGPWVSEHEDQYASKHEGRQSVRVDESMRTKHEGRQSVRVDESMRADKV